jgi:nucleotide-binding universal stress UspA family protein
MAVTSSVEVKMQGFKNILVVREQGTADTRALLEPAIELAAPASGVVTLLDLTSRPVRRKRSSASGPIPTPVHRLYDPGPDLRKLGVPVHHETARGVPHLEVLERIAVFGHDLVVMDSGPDIGRMSLAGRSTTTRVLRSSRVPVLLHPEGGRTAGAIAVAVGPQDADDPADFLNKKLLETAASLARAFKRELHVIHAWQLDGETMMRGSRLNYEAADIGRMAREAQFEARIRAEELLADIGAADLIVVIHVERGHVDDVIATLSGKLAPGILVMGTISRQGIQGLVVGNKVERVARRTKSPLLAVKPDGSAKPPLALEEWTPRALPY